MTLNKKIDTPIAVAFLLLILIIVLAWMEMSSSDLASFSWSFLSRRLPHGNTGSQLKGMEKFASAEEFESYLKKAEEAQTSYQQVGRGGMIFEETMPISAPTVNLKGTAEESADRVSGTNVQVRGVDEPDIVKVDNQRIYFSASEYYWRGPIIMEEFSVEKITPSYQHGGTNIINAFPPEDLDKESTIDRAGNLLLSGDVLVMFSGSKIYGYDVSNPKDPEEKWDIDFEENGYLADARLYNGKVYVVTRNYIDREDPCPFVPLSVGGDPLSVECTDIYHPIAPVQSDVTFSAFIVNADSGKVEKTVSFLGSSGDSVFYMSKSNLYVTYYYPGDFTAFIYNFLESECKDLMPKSVLTKIDKLKSYDISAAAKSLELENIIQQWQNSLDRDDRLRIDNELSNRMADYYKNHGRDLGRTGIIKVDLEDFDIAATGDVPGTPLDQFSLDEYENHLRIATTIGNFWGWGSIRGTSESANDVYVLDEKLAIQGSVINLGKTEKIYSVRFIEDKGYVVTFRQVDPFYVLDLSDPKEPTKEGELKISGYSSYLHPISKDKILGIGMEGSQVKISLFDVSDPKNPEEISKYNLDEYWTEVSTTHHAFLLDKKHSIFFLPGSKGGYIFSYANDDIILKKAVSGIAAKRAVYMEDYLYIIGDNEISVFDENNWKKVNDLEL